MKAYETAKIGKNKGVPRIWLVGMMARMAGFLLGMRYNIRQDAHRKMLVLELNDKGFRVVSRQCRSGHCTPVIDINSPQLLQILDGFESVRVIVQNTRIVFLRMHVDLAKREQLERLKCKPHAHEPIAMGSLSHGGGVMSHAIHSGLEVAVVTTWLAFANDIRPELRCTAC